MYVERTDIACPVDDYFRNLDHPVSDYICKLTARTAPERST